MKIFIKTSPNIYIYWNIGSIIFTNLIIQIIVGVLISMKYFYPSNNYYFNSMFIFYIIQYNWIMRLIHSNLTSIIFITLYIHIFRSLIYSNFYNLKMWISGLMMFFLIMMIAFFGYMLINSQMSYWASMVITNLITLIPMIGKKILLWIWGNYFINKIFLNKIFSIHFLLPMMILIISIIHLMILHLKKSTNPLNINNKIDLINIQPLFLIKDYFIYLFMMILFIFMMNYPIFFNNNDNFNFINTMKTPKHIEPEWYFMFFYSILRLVKNKTSSIIILMMIMIKMILLPINNSKKMILLNFNWKKKIYINIMIMLMILISMMGYKFSIFPYDLMNYIFTILLIIILMILNI